MISRANGPNSAAFGFGAQAEGSSSVALGSSSRTEVAALNGTALGSAARAYSNQSTAVGYNTKAQGVQSTAVGSSARAYTAEATALGNRATAQGAQSTALGNDSLAYGYSSMSNGGNRSANNNVGLKFSEPTSDGSTNPAAPSGGNVAANLRGLFGTSDYVASQYFRRNVAAGENSQAWGTHAQALGDGSVAMGLTATAGDGTGKFGANRTDGMTSFSSTSGEHSIAIGSLSWAKSDNSIAMGLEAQATGKDAVAIGTEAEATAADAFALGESSKASGANSLALGAESQAKTQSSVAIGRATSATGTGSTAIGGGAGSAAEADGSGAVAIGGGYASNVAAKASASRTVAIGNASNASVTDAVALGSKSVADRKALTGVSASATPTGNQVFAGSAATAAEKTAITNTVKGSLAAVSVGSSTETRQIINVAAGRDDTDAVNVAQLKAVSNAANRETYFHTNPTAAKVAESGKNNQDVVDGVGAATGEFATAAGYNAAATGTRSSAVGVDSSASGNQSSAFGDDAQAKGNNSLAMGSVSRAGAQGATAIGSGATVRAGGTSGTVVGTNASGSEFDVVVGAGALATGKSDADGFITKSGGKNTVIGYEGGKNLNGMANGIFGYQAGTNIDGNDNNAIGFKAGENLVGNANNVLGYKAGVSTEGDRNSLIGHNAGGGGYGAAFAMKGNDNVANGTGALGASNGDNNVGVGVAAGAQVSGSNNIAIGNQAGTLASITAGKPTAGAPQTYSNSVNIGNKTQALANSAVALGDSAKTSIENAVAIGSNSVADRKSGSDGYNPITGAVDTKDAGITATKSTLAAVSIGASGKTRQIINVAAGTNDTDAVNVAQLKALREGVIGYTAGVGGFGLKAQDGNEVTKALGNTIEIVGGGTTAGTYTTNNVKTVVSGGQIQIQMAESPKFGAVTVNDGNTGRITGVTAGVADKDAVNVSQLNTLGSSVASSLGGTSAYDNKTGKVTAGLDVGGTTYTTVQDALNQVNAKAGVNNTTRQVKILSLQQLRMLTVVPIIKFKLKMKLALPKLQ